MPTKKSRKIPFRGAGCALVTPFTSGAIESDALARMIEFQIGGGTDAIVLLGTTGESPAVETDERQEMIAFAAERIAGRVPLIVGCGSNSTAHAVFLTRLACQAGADAILSVTPYYNKTNEDGLVRHFTEIADASCCPVILYNVPSRTNVDIPLTVYEKLSAHENIAGVKESSGSMTRAGEILAHTDLALYSGNDGDNVPLLALGASGVISVLANVMPETVSRMCTAAFAGDFATASRLQIGTADLVRALFSDVNPIPVKAACAAMGLCGGDLRLPLVPLDEAKRMRLVQAMKSAGIWVDG